MNSENRIITLAFGLCFALALFVAAHAQNGSNPTGGGGGGSGGITAGAATSGCTDKSFVWSSSSAVACGGEISVSNSANISVDASHNFALTGGGRGFISSANNGNMAVQVGGSGNNYFGWGPSGNDSSCLGYNAGGAGATITCVLSWSDGTGIGAGLARHHNYNGAAPVVSSCGTGSPAIDANANDSSGAVTIGTVATSCTITFAAPYVTYVHCVVTTQSAVSGLAYSYTKTAITVSASVLGGDSIDYRCDGV